MDTSNKIVFNVQKLRFDWPHAPYYRQISKTRRILVDNNIIDPSEIVGASTVGAAPTTSSFST